MIQIHDTLTRQKKDFIPLDPAGKKINMYTCGVTVYDDCHIGHARSLYIFDVIRRYLKYRGYDVTLVRNITDIDDKIINRANELKVDWKELVDKYIAKYYEDLGALGVEKADLEPRATENIPEMISYISRLIEKGFAYATSTGVYFSVRKLSGYGKLSGQSVEQMLTGVRKAADETKEDPLDFALWKLSKPGEPSWPSPWGAGRPGWHIECSVMSQKYLKTDTLDIHAGGRDLVFPHHENEIAQAEALTGKTFANYWVHHGLLTINTQKMSKSLGNFITIQNVLGRYPADVLKILYLQAHYNSPVDFSWEKMEEAKKAYEHIAILMSQLDRLFGAGSSSGVVQADAGGMGYFRNDFIESMDDDFNTSKGLAVLFDMVKKCNSVLSGDAPDKKVLLAAGMKIIKEITGVFGLNFLKQECSGISSEEIESKIAARIAFKQKKQYQEADAIRKELEQKGIILEDTKDGKTTWRRKI